mmetsp:Transcript_4809/g.14490  ORF Transcript_4809/g.14490 Transcript_4809/m.14490 type:complete len:192 (+) Transcript_4809:109-684(+)
MAFVGAESLLHRRLAGRSCTRAAVCARRRYCVVRCEKADDKPDADNESSELDYDVLQERIHKLEESEEEEAMLEDAKEKIMKKLRNADSEKYLFLSYTKPNEGPIKPVSITVQGADLCLLFETKHEAKIYASLQRHMNGKPAYIIEAVLSVIMKLCKANELFLGIVPQGTVQVENHSVEDARKAFEDLFNK